MPCITLSSGKTVCFGDDNKSTRNQPIPFKKPTTVNISQEVLRTIPQFKDQPLNPGTITATQEKSFNPLDLLDVPQKVMMEALTTEYIKPSQYMANRDFGNDNQRLAADLLLDPLNLLPVAKGVTLLKGDTYLTALEKIYNTIRNYGTKIDNTEDIISGTNFQNPTYSQGGTIFFNHQPVHFPDGGKTFPPIYTSDRNDPRLKSYQDSVYVRTKSDQTFEKGNKTRPLTEKEKKEWRDERTGLLPNVVEYNPNPNTKYDYYGHFKKPVQPVIYKPIERTTLEPVESRTVPMLESNFEHTPITPMSVDRPMMQPSNEEYNRQYSITIPTIEINKRQVAPRVNRVLGQNRVNPKNQYQRSIDFGSRELPITDEYKLNQLRMKLGMDPKGFQDGGKTDDAAFKKFVSTLPPNLKNTGSDYNLRGYWESLGKPSAFDYSQPKESDGMYHAYSRNSETGEILKKPNHPTFGQALEEDRKIGYYPYQSPSGVMHTFKPNEVPQGFKVPIYPTLNNIKKNGGKNSKTIRLSTGKIITLK